MGLFDVVYMGIYDALCQERVEERVKSAVDNIFR